MAQLGAVRVATAAVDKAVRSAGYQDVWLLLDTGADLGQGDRLGDLADVVNTANAAAEARVEATYGTGFTASPRGLVIQVRDLDSLSDVRRWLTDLATGLEERGFTGTLTAAPKTDRPLWLVHMDAPLVPAAFHAYAVNLDTIAPARLASAVSEPHLYGSWHVTDDATDAICGYAAEWAEFPDATAVLNLDDFHLAVQSGVTDALVRGVRTTGHAGVEYIDDPGFHATHAAFQPEGTGAFQIVGGPLTLPKRVFRLRDTLTALAPELEHGFVRTTVSASPRLTGNTRLTPLPNGLQEHHVLNAPHLRDRYLPDVHCLQVVRSAHLDHADGLPASRWTITDLGGDRHLVQAVDLKAWFSQPDLLPDPDVLAQARADFAGALLTEQVVADNPAPWYPRLHG